MARSFFNSKLWQAILQRLGVLETSVGSIPPAEDYNSIADVRAETVHLDGDRIFCLENQIVYIFDDTSTAPDDGSLVLKPTDIDSGDPGRWVFEQQLALRDHTHDDKADKITAPNTTRFLQANSGGNPVEGNYSANSFAAASHTHEYASAGDITNLEAAIDALDLEVADKMDKYAVLETDVGKPAVFDANGNVIPGETIKFYSFRSGALTAGVTKQVSHNQDMTVGYIPNVRNQDDTNNANVTILMPNAADPSNVIDIQSAVDIPEPGLLIQILGA